MAASQAAAAASEEQGNEISFAESLQERNAYLQTNYLGIILSSYHFGTNELNNFTPGITLGKRFQKPSSRWEYQIEGGVFYNSYEEISPILLGGISTHMFDFAEGEFRIGAGVGTAYYERISGTLKDKLGLPNLGGFIPIVSLTASYRRDQTEYRLTTIPPGDASSFILNASVTFTF